MKEIMATIEIDVPAERVWAVLMDLPSYPDWNPFIVELSGDTRLGQVLRAHARIPGRRDMKFNTKVSSLKENREFLLDSTYVRGLVYGKHGFAIEPLGPKRARFSQRVVFSGILVPLMGGLIRDTQKGLEQMNVAMKKRCEGTKWPKEADHN
jgi:hypothetical protein